MEQQDTIFKQMGAVIKTKITDVKTDVLATYHTDFETNASGEIDVKKHLVPADATVSLGTVDKPFADIYISQSSLYVNGTKVLSENSGTIDISADPDQNIRISTKGAGDIEFYPSGLGVIQLKGSVSIPSTKKLITHDGNAMQMGQDLIVDGDVAADNITALTTKVSSLETLTTSDDINLDTVQEIITFIKQNKSDLDSISLDWSALQNVPTTFTPSSHAHNLSDITNLQTALDAKVDDTQVQTNVPANALFTDSVYTKPTAEPISYITNLQTALDAKVFASELGTIAEFEAALNSAI